MRRTPAPTVAVAKADREDLLNEVTIAAEFRPYVEAELNAKVSGYLKIMNVDFGDKVKAGQLLATLEVPELQDQLDNAIAVEQRDEADYTNAHLIYTRLVLGEPRAAGFVAQQEVDTAEAKDSVARGPGGNCRCQSRRGKIPDAGGIYQITAPFDGVVTCALRRPGRAHPGRHHFGHTGPPAGARFGQLSAPAGFSRFRR